MSDSTRGGEGDVIGFVEILSNLAVVAEVLWEDLGRGLQLELLDAEVRLGVLEG